MEEIWKAKNAKVQSSNLTLPVWRPIGFPGFLAFIPGFETQAMRKQRHTSGGITIAGSDRRRRAGIRRI